MASGGVTCPSGHSHGLGAILVAVLIAGTWRGGPPSTGLLAAGGGLALAAVRVSSVLGSGVYDAAYLLQELRRPVACAGHFGESFALALLEPSGKPAGGFDASHRVGAAARAVDVVSKLDDGRLCILMPRVGEGEARELAERLRAASGQDRASVGVVVRRPGVSAEDLLELAERLVDAARRLGANHVRGPEPDVLLEGSRLAPQTQLRQLRELVASLDAHELVSLLDGTRHGAAFSLTAALTEIWRHADGRFDPAVVSALFRLLRDGGLESLQIEASAEPLPVFAS